MIAIAIVFILAGPWMMDVMTSYTVNLFDGIAMMVRE
jgi:flagellar biosynthesis protein FliQ